MEWTSGSFLTMIFIFLTYIKPVSKTKSFTVFCFMEFKTTSVISIFTLYFHQLPSANGYFIAIYVSNKQKCLIQLSYFKFCLKSALLRRKKKVRLNSTYWVWARQPGATVFWEWGVLCTLVSSNMSTCTSVTWPGKGSSMVSIFSTRLSPWWPTAPLWIKKAESERAQKAFKWCIGLCAVSRSIMNTDRWGESCISGSNWTKAGQSLYRLSFIVISVLWFGFIIGMIE